MGLGLAYLSGMLYVFGGQTIYGEIALYVCAQNSRAVADPLFYLMFHSSAASVLKDHTVLVRVRP